MKATAQDRQIPIVLKHNPRTKELLEAPSVVLAFDERGVPVLEVKIVGLDEFGDRGEADEKRAQAKILAAYARLSREAASIWRELIGARPRPKKQRDYNLNEGTRVLLARVHGILARLNSGAATTAAKLAAEFEVTERTIQRDLDFMRDRLRIPIQSDNTGYRLPRPVHECPICCERCGL